MKKSVLERFLNKYHLNGAEAVTWVVNDKTGTSVQFISDDKHVVGTISTSELSLDEGSYSIYETGNLHRLITILDDELKIKAQTTNGKNTALTFSDKQSKVTFVLADVGNIPTVPALKQLPDFEVVISLTKDVMERYVKSCGALPDTQTFTVISDGKKTDIVLGYTNVNSNRVTLSAETSVQEKIAPISFHARYFKDIILANKEADCPGELFIATGGLAKITFTLPDFKVTYYLPQIKTED